MYILRQWRKHKLSLFGKITIIKTFALPQFVLPASLLVVPPNTVKQIDTLFYQFLWGSPDKIKRVKLIQPYQQGGLNMIDVKSFFTSLKAIWIERLLKSDTNVHNWSQLPYTYLKPLLECHTKLKFNIKSNVDFHDATTMSNFIGLKNKNKKTYLLIYTQWYIYIP